MAKISNIIPGNPSQILEQGSQEEGAAFRVGDPSLASYQSRIMLQAPDRFSEIADEVGGDPDKFAQASEEYISGSVIAAPTVMQEDVGASLQNEARKKGAVLASEKRRTQVREINSNMRELATRQIHDVLGSAGEEDFEPSVRSLNNTLIGMENLPDVRWSPEQSQSVIKSVVNGRVPAIARPKILIDRQAQSLASHDIAAESEAEANALYDLESEFPDEMIYSSFDEGVSDKFLNFVHSEQEKSAAREGYADSIPSDLLDNGILPADEYLPETAADFEFYGREDLLDAETREGIVDLEGTASIFSPSQNTAPIPPAKEDDADFLMLLEGMNDEDDRLAQATAAYARGKLTQDTLKSIADGVEADPYGVLGQMNAKLPADPLNRDQAKRMLSLRDQAVGIYEQSEDPAKAKEEVNAYLKEALVSEANTRAAERGMARPRHLLIGPATIQTLSESAARTREAFESGRMSQSDFDREAEVITDWFDLIGGLDGE